MLKNLCIAFLFYLAGLEYRVFANANADECSLNTQCKPMKQCPYVRNNLSIWKTIPYCNRNQTGTFVCCPAGQVQYVQTKDANLRSVQECLSYRTIRSNCSRPLIVGGTKAESKEFPFMALLSNYNGKQHNWVCGGTLISSKFVLTAAHCFILHNPNNVRLGELDYNTTTDDARPIDFGIKGNATLHPHYNYIKRFNDIALVELDGTVTFDEYIMPACLPLIDGKDFDEFFATGWGSIRDAAPSSSHMLKVKLDYFKNDVCRAKLEEDSLTVINTTIQMCAGSFSHKRDTCTGDSGGPLFVDHPDYKCMFLILGVTSYGEDGCANVNFPAFYTRVSSYIDWIESIVWR